MESYVIQTPQKGPAVGEILNLYRRGDLQPKRATVKKILRKKGSQTDADYQWFVL
jgi:hypothetical protein